MNTLEVLITPSYEFTRDSLGYSEEEDFNRNTILFQ